MTKRHFSILRHLENNGRLEDVGFEKCRAQSEDCLSFFQNITSVRVVMFSLYGYLTTPLTLIDNSGWLCSTVWGSEGGGEDNNNGLIQKMQ